MPAPTNQTALTAIDIGILPFTISQNVRFDGTTFTVWYSYTAKTDEKVATFFFFGDLVGYNPTTTVNLGPASAPVAYLGGIAGVNVAVLIPLTAGVTYYFEVQSTSTPDPAILNVEAQLASSLNFPLGSLLVPEAGANRLFPAAILSAIDGEDFTVLGYATPWADAVAADILADGTILTYSDVDVELQIYNTSLVLGAVLSFTPSTAAILRAQRTGGNFYIGETNNGGNATIRTVSTALALGSVFDFPLAGLSSFAVNSDDTIAYFSGQASPFNSQVERWDLTLDVALSDLAPDHGNDTGGGPFLVASMLVLSDDTIAVFYIGSGTLPHEGEVVVYNPNGTIVGTYNLGNVYSNSSNPSIAFALDDPNSFWVAVNYNTPAGQSRYVNIKASDGSILADVDHMNYTSGQYQGPQIATPVSFFGPSGCSGHHLMIIQQFRGFNVNSGLVVIVPDKDSDTIWNDPITGTVTEVKIPDPFIKTGLVGE